MSALFFAVKAALTALLFACFVVFVGLFVGAVISDDQTDWAPWVFNDSELDGAWTAPSAWLTVAAGRYVCTGAGCNQFGSTGRWRREGDFYVILESEEHRPWELRLGVKEGALILADGATEMDPDEWNPVVKLTRVERWQVPTERAPVERSPESSPTRGKIKPRSAVHQGVAARGSAS